jgi:tetratricopeptide (TPR) repeat protein
MKNRFPRRLRMPLCITGVMLYCLLALPTFSTLTGNLPAFAGDKTVTPREERKDLVAQGVRQYEAGDIEAARKTLESAKPIFQSDPSVPYYLGVIDLQEGRRSAAISEWQQYVAMAPGSEDAMKIRKYLTLLSREEAVAYARKAVAEESALLNGPVVEDALAVMPFHNLGSESLGPLGKGMAAMLISDLSQVPDLHVVERIRLQALLQEMDLGASGVVDPKTAPKVGKLLKSGNVVTGSLTDPEKEMLQIISVLMNTEQTKPADTRDTSGPLAELFDLEKRIACDIVEGLGRNCDSMPEAFRRIHTRNYQAFIFWARGLDALDAGRFSEAREWFQKALDEDPTFDLAKDALSSTPLPGMSAMSSLQMISSLSGESFPAPWQAIFRSLLAKNNGQQGNETLREALRLAFSVGKNGKDQRAGDCLKMALEMGYPSYIALKTIFEEGDGLDLGPMCESASTSGVMKAVFAKAARDAVSQSDNSIYDMAQISQCPCLSGEKGLGYTPAEENLKNFPPNSIPNAPPVSAIIP